MLGIVGILALPRCFLRGLSLVRPAGAFNILAVLPHRPLLAMIEATGLVVGLKYLDFRGGHLNVIFGLAPIGSSPLVACGGVCTALATVDAFGLVVPLRIPLRGGFSACFLPTDFATCRGIIFSHLAYFSPFLYFILNIDDKLGAAYHCVRFILGNFFPFESARTRL